MSEDIENARIAERLIRPATLKLEPYVPGKAVEEVQEKLGLVEVIKMASNENPWGASPKALKAVGEELPKVYQYPEGSCRELRLALADHLGVQDDMVTVSNGADNVLMLLAQAFVDPGTEVIMGTPTFPIYRNATILMGGTPKEVPLKDFTHDLDSMGRAAGSRTRMLIVCNPNSPTGTIVEEVEIQRFLNELPDDVLLVVDEVYGDFASGPEFPDTLAHIREGKAVISVRSFSKLYGLAGLRVGYAVGPPSLILALNRVREPFPVNRLAAAAAKGALEDNLFRDQVLRGTEQGRTFLYDAFKEMGLRCLPSHTNFVFVDLGVDSQLVHERLMRRGIIIRPGGIWKTPTWCRITVGTLEQNKRLIDALKAVLRDLWR